MNDSTTTTTATTEFPARGRRNPDLAEPSVSVARNTPSPGLLDSEASIDMPALRSYRLARVREQLARHDCAACVLFDPINIRYATGARNMAVWTLHNAARYCFVAADGPVVLFDFHNCQHLSRGLGTVDEVRPTSTWFYMAAGPQLEARAERWAGEIADLVRAHGGGNSRLAIDHCNPEGVVALARLGIEVRNGEAPMELARVIKSPEEIACMNVSMAVCEAGMARMRDALEAGMSENRLWSILNQTNTEMGGEWIETRLLSSGGRTNPWFQECGERIIRPGELVSYDTDLIGPFGYCADVSRSHFCGPGRPSDAQRELYQLAWEQVHYNMALLEAGVGFRELAEKAWKIPERFVDNRYSSIVHGVGLCDEYPKSPHLMDFERAGYEGEFETGMTVCVESYIGEAGGDEGVKLEQQVLITPTGVELLSTFPFEDELLRREV